MSTDLQQIVSINDLQCKAKEDPKYEQLAIIAARNLGAPTADYPNAIVYLSLSANESQDEQGVVDEINFCLDLIP